MNKSNYSLFLDKAGSGSTNLLVSFLTTPSLFKYVYDDVFVFILSNSRASIKDNIFDENIPEYQIYDDVSYDDLEEVYEIAKRNALKNIIH
jgi:uncharacterized Fe-S radical SAM superfamily protein PflX